MPKGFIGDKAILTKDDFVNAMLISRGYEQNENGDWELIYPELSIPKTTAISPAKKVTKVAKPTTLKPAKSTTGITKEVVIANVNQFLNDNDYKYSANKATFMVTLGNENYEFKITRKVTAFEFEGEFEGVQDFGKQKFIKLLSALDFCDVGIVDRKGTIGFTDGKEFVTITITKKRK